MNNEKKVKNLSHFCRTYQAIVKYNTKVQTSVRTEGLYMTAKEELIELIQSLTAQELQEAFKIFQERFSETREAPRPPFPKAQKLN